MSCVEAPSHAEARSAAILPFRPGRRPGAVSRRRDPSALLDGIYAAGSLVVEAGDRDTKALAARLQIAGFVVVEEVSAEGARRLRPSEAVRACAERPWRVSKPGLPGPAVRVGGRAG